MNQYRKFAPNVFIVASPDFYEHNSEIIVTTKHGKENTHKVHKLIRKLDETYYYSVIKNYNYAEKKVEKLKSFQESANKKSSEYYQKSNKDSSFLSLGEPIKVGHHSEKRHRKIIDQANNNMGKSVEFAEKAKEYESKIDYWENKVHAIDLSMPESIDYFSGYLLSAKAHHKYLKDNPEKRPHGMALGYAKKKVNDIEKKLKLAKILWEL